MSEVSVSRLERRMVLISPDISLTEGDDVVALSERIRIVVHWLKDHLGIFSGCLPSGRSVIGPFGNIFDASDWFVHNSGFSSHVEASVVDPDVFDTGLRCLGPVLDSLVVLCESRKHRV